MTTSRSQVGALRRHAMSIERRKDIQQVGGSAPERESPSSGTTASTAASLISTATGTAAPPDVTDEGAVGAANGRLAREQHTHGSQDLKRYALLVG